MAQEEWPLATKPEFDPQKKKKEREKKKEKTPTLLPRPPLPPAHTLTVLSWNSLYRLSCLQTQSDMHTSA